MYIEKISWFLAHHENISQERFIAILNLANTQKFDIYKLEKDFLLTLVLIRFWEIYPELVFKWGTCLNKIYFPYFRLSEDLDFVISKNIWRASRKSHLKKYEQSIIHELSKLWIILREKIKIREHTVWLFTFEYMSIIDTSLQTIKIDISLWKELVRPTYTWIIQSIYRDEILEESIFWEQTIMCIDIQESLAEKIRAALTRTTPAIRDFFDIWYVRTNSDFDFWNANFKKLVDIKLAEVDYNYTLEWNYSLLQKQIQTDLEPVLHKSYDFSLREIHDFILTFKK